MEINSSIAAAGFLAFLAAASVVINCETDPNDARILNDFARGLENPELLKWPLGDSDPCGPPPWPHIFCSNDGRVTQIQVQGLGLRGPLPPDLNLLDRLQNVGLQRNSFNGNLPTFTGLSDLQFAYLDFNEFDSIPVDFFTGLTIIRVLALDSNPFNRTAGWTLPPDLADCGQLVNFSCSGCNIAGALPEFLGSLPSLASLRLSYNRLAGTIPASFRGSMLQTLWLNDQDSDGLTGPIDIIADMPGLAQVWLHGNTFSGTIPGEIGHLTSLRDLNLNRNRLVGTIPITLAEMELQRLDLSNNMLMGQLPKFKSKNTSYESNAFCLSVPGEECAPEVTALLEFLRGLNYPARLATEWGGNDPCLGPWWGISCNPKGQVTVVNLQRLMLNGTLSASLVDLPSLIQLHLEGNNLNGTVPANLTQLSSLRLLNLSGNDFEPPLPKFCNEVEVVTNGNLKFQHVGLDPDRAPSSAAEPPRDPETRPKSPSLGGKSKSPSGNPSSGGDWVQEHKSPYVVSENRTPTNPKKSRILFIAAAAGGFVILVLLVLVLALYCHRSRAMKKYPPSSIVIHPRDSSDPSNIVKVSSANGSALEAQNVSGMTNVIESGNLQISLQVLRKVTNNFAQENEIGRGGFGVVYKGEVEDGAKLAVKRMVVGTISNKALDEFQSEIAVLSKVRHRNLVSLLGYAVEGNERLLVYEYMPQGALSRHLFRPGLEPLLWTRRLNIALDVARGVEYLHSLAHQSFIHRDLKSSNILLDDDFRAKVSDFGLVKLAPDRERSVATRLAGTFGYLAPEYAVTGKITTKVDVFSFGVVLMELLTGLVALDDQRHEENRYLAEWFWQIKSNRESLMAAIDPALDAKQDNYETIQTIATLAGHCTARDPNHRPEMGHAVNVLAQLVEEWKPYEETDDFSGIDLTLPLPQMLKGWQEETDSRNVSGSTSQDSKGSIPAKPAGFADSFTSADAR